MSNGVFGSIRPAIINPMMDVEMLYMYRPSRSETSTEFDSGMQSLDPSICLNTMTSDSGNTIDGMYTLKLPLDKFNKKGFYTIFIRPKEIKCTIKDVSVLATYPDVRGIVFDTNEEGLKGLTDLTGYRIEFNRDGYRESRLIKSCNYCDATIINTGDNTAKVTKYILNTVNTNMLFCTVSPSSAPTFRPNAKPYIGTPGEEITLVNTKFSPKLIEVEMVDHDMDTLSYMLEGDQVNDKDNAIITTYNDRKEIYHQADYYVLKDGLGKPLYTVRKQRTSIDATQDYDNIID